jgi:cell shape-determining protein MreC
MVAWLHKIRQWLEIALVIALAVFVYIHFIVNKNPASVTLPGGQVINMDTKSFTNAVNAINKQIADQSKQINNLESTIRQLNTQAITHDIPAALAEKDVKVSVNTMLGAW